MRKRNAHLKNTHPACRMLWKSGGGGGGGGGGSGSGSGGSSSIQTEAEKRLKSAHYAGANDQLLKERIADAERIVTSSKQELASYKSAIKTGIFSNNAEDKAFIKLLQKDIKDWTHEGKILKKMLEIKT